MDENTEAQTETAVDAEVERTPEDPFADAKPLPGLEHLGRAIVDADGNPSGSPANFEATRGARFPLGHEERSAAEGAEELLKEHQRAMLEEHGQAPQ